MAVRIIKQTFELIFLLTGKNPIQVLVDAITHTGAREDSTRIGGGGVVRRTAVDVSPLRRVNQGIYLICCGARDNAFKTYRPSLNVLQLRSLTQQREPQDHM